MRSTQLFLLTSDSKKPGQTAVLYQALRLMSSNVCFKKTGTNGSSDTLLCFVPVFFETDVISDFKHMI